MHPLHVVSPIEQSRSGAQDNSTLSRKPSDQSRRNSENPRILSTFHKSLKLNKTNPMRHRVRLDHTLLPFDSDKGRDQFLIDVGAVDEAYYHENNERFYQDYLDACLDIRAYNGSPAVLQNFVIGDCLEISVRSRNGSA